MEEIIKLSEEIMAKRAELKALEELLRERIQFLSDGSPEKAEKPSFKASPFPAKLVPAIQRARDWAKVGEEFDVPSLAAVIGVTPDRAYALLSALVREGAIKRVRRGVYEAKGKR